MKDYEMIKAIEAINKIQKDKHQKETFEYKKQPKQGDSNFDILLKKEQDKLKEKEEQKQQLIRLKQGRAYINYLQKTYEEEQVRIERKK